MWPEFSDKEFLGALSEFEMRERRFGSPRASGELIPGVRMTRVGSHEDDSRGSRMNTRTTTDADG
jgi:hypothetical protein